jgi:hypothetical protein
MERPLLLIVASDSPSEYSALSGVYHYDQAPTNQKTEQLQNAINEWLVAYGVATLYFAPGTYKMDSTLHLDGEHIRLVGSGQNNTFFRTLLSAQSSTLISSTNARLHLEGVTLDCRAIGQAVDIKSDNERRATFTTRNVNIESRRGHGLVITAKNAGTTTATLTSTVITDCHQLGLKVGTASNEDTGTIILSTDRLTCTRCGQGAWIGNAKSGTHMEPDPKKGDYVLRTPTLDIRCRMSNSDFSDNEGYGIAIQADHAIMRGVVATNNYYHGIVTTKCKGVKIISCRTDGNGTSEGSNGAGISIGEKSTDFLVSHCVCRGNYTHGITVDLAYSESDDTPREDGVSLRAGHGVVTHNHLLFNGSTEGFYGLYLHRLYGVAAFGNLIRANNLSGLVSDGDRCSIVGNAISEHLTPTPGIFCGKAILLACPGNDPNIVGASSLHANITFDNLTSFLDRQTALPVPNKFVD